ncbi:MAG: hypothetical protein SFV54_02525 [Bryobacteraceae bacterium]|nr:hypothetical protein [Bryobacteraceae bacterium]
MRLFLSLLLSASLVPAQTASQQKKAVTRPAPAAAKPKPAKAPAKEPEWRIERITVEGNKIYTENQILEAAGLRLRMVGNKQVFDAARDKLLATGAFENIGYRYQPSAANTGFDVSLQVQEVQQVYPYKFEGLPAEDKELQEVLKKSDLLLGNKLPATETILKRYSAALQRYLEGRGFRNQVQAKVRLEGENELMVVFGPDRPPITVAEIRFTGTTVIPEAALRRAVAESGIGIVYQESRFRRMLEYTVKPLYDERGRLAAAFTKIETAPAEKVRGIVVTVAVDEGDVYTLKNVTVTGTELKPTFAIGEPANMKRVGEEVDTLLTALRRKGYLKAAAAVDRKLEPKAKSADLYVTVSTGPQFTMGRLTLKGLDILGEAAIKRLWGLKEGEPFDGTYPEHFLKRIEQDQVFDNLKKTKAETRVSEEEKIVDVTLHFQ